MRLLALLLLAAAIGFAVGRLTAPDVGGLRGQRRPPPKIPAGEQPPPRAIAQEPRVPEPKPPAEDVVVQPTEPIRADGTDSTDETGVIEVELDGGTRAWAGWRTMTGGYEEYPLDADEGEHVVRFDLPAGVYDVWSLDREGRRRGGRAAVEGGKRTVVVAADYDGPPPVPAGLGVLEVEVEATWGGGLACGVNVHGRDEARTISTNVHGRGSITLAPGRYTVWVGGRQPHPLTVADGQTSSLRIVHEGDGDLILEGDELPGDLAIAPPGEPFQRRDLWAGFVGGELRYGLVYLEEGEYDLYVVRDGRDRLGVPLGRAAVHAGRTTFFRYDLPRGGLDLRVVVQDRASDVAVLVRRADASPVAQRAGGAMELRWVLVKGEARTSVRLAPGRYSVKPMGVGYRPVEVDVGDRMVELELAPER